MLLEVVCSVISATDMSLEDHGVMQRYSEASATALTTRYHTRYEDTFLLLL